MAVIVAPDPAPAAFPVAPVRRVPHLVCIPAAVAVTAIVRLIADVRPVGYVRRDA